jgi:hypothetical protein
MTTRGSEAAVRGRLACSIDHHACSAAYAQERRRRGWSQPTAGPDRQTGSS